MFLWFFLDVEGFFSFLNTNYRRIQLGEMKMKQMSIKFWKNVEKRSCKHPPEVDQTRKSRDTKRSLNVYIFYITEEQFKCVKM